MVQIENRRPEEETEQDKSKDRKPRIQETGQKKPRERNCAKNQGSNRSGTLPRVPRLPNIWLNLVAFCVSFRTAAMFAQVVPITKRKRANLQAGPRRVSSSQRPSPLRSLTSGSSLWTPPNAAYKRPSHVSGSRRPSVYTRRRVITMGTAKSQAAWLYVHRPSSPLASCRWVSLLRGAAKLREGALCGRKLHSLPLNCPPSLVVQEKSPAKRSQEGQVGRVRSIHADTGLEDITLGCSVHTRGGCALRLTPSWNALLVPFT